MKLEFGCELFSRELWKEGRQEADAIFLLPPAGALEPFCACLEAAEAAARGSLDCSFGHVFLNFRPAVAASRVVVLPMGHFFKVLGPAWSLLLHPHPEHFKSAYFPALNAFCLKALNPDISEGCSVATNGDSLKQRGHIQAGHVWGRDHWPNFPWPCADSGLPNRYHSHQTNHRWDE